MRRQRGVALLTAVLAVALAVVLVAALLDRGSLARARTAHALRAEQSWQLLLGMEGWALRALRDEEAAQPNVDGHGDLWSRPLPPIEVPGGLLSGQLHERGGCLNLNALADGSGLEDTTQQRLQRLLVALRLDPAIAAAARDWVDADLDARSGGGEDLHYATADPPYRAANRRFVHGSELRLLRGVDDAAYQRLRPHVCALPDPATPMNLNTATPELWMSLDPRISESMARRLWREGRARYDDLAAVQQELERELGLPAGQGALLLQGTAVQTHWFVMEAEITLDGLPFLYSSLLYRGPSGPAAVARVRGRW